jgi:hypothetical protein
MGKQSRQKRDRHKTNLLVIELGGARGRPLPSVQAFVEQHRHTFRPGVHQIVTMHDSGCRYPAGRPCTCVAGPEFEIVGLEPERN